MTSCKYTMEHNFELCSPTDIPYLIRSHFAPLISIMYIKSYVEFHIYLEGRPSYVAEQLYAKREKPSNNK